MKKMSKLFLVVLAVVMALCISTVGASASALEDEPIEVTFTEADDAATVLTSAIETAEADGITVVIKLNANMVFTEDVTIGESKETHNGLVKVESAVDSEGAPLYGIEVAYDTLVNCYGNFAFDNIQYIYNIPAGTSYSWSSGGCFQFTEGLGVWGENGVIECTPEKRIHLAGKFEVYSGNYGSLSGNYYKSGVEVVNPSVYVAGDTVADYAFGGAHNGNNTNTKVSGACTLYIGGDAVVSKAAVGSWYSATNSIGGTGTVEGNATVNTLALVAGSANTNDYPLYTLNLKGGTLGTVSADMANSPGAWTAINGKFNITMPTGSIGTFYGGLHSNFDTVTSANAYTVAATATKFYGTIEINLSGSPEIGTFYGGSYFRAAGSIHDADVTINVNGAALSLGSDFYSGSRFGSNFTYKQKDVDDGNGGKTTVSTAIANVDCVHSGDTTVNLLDGSRVLHNTDTTKGRGFYCGSYVGATDGVHSGDITVNAKITEGSTATYSIEISDTLWLGSGLRSTRAKHTGKITATLENVYANLKTSSWGALAGGSYITGAMQIT